MKYVTLTLISFFLLIMTSNQGFCQAQGEDAIIQKYIKDHNLKATKDPSGVYYVIEKEGTGGHPDINSTVEVKYKGTLTNGTVFDETKDDKTIKFPLSNLIKGWQIGIPKLQKGGKGTFIIPSQLGYGNRDMGKIPANSVLVFEITLVNF